MARIHKRFVMLAATISVFAVGSAGGAHASVIFNTFVSASAITTVEGQDNTIAFNYAGNKFVGSVYFGANNAQLYSTDLNGSNVQKFGTPIPAASGEVVLAASLGKGGFGVGDIYTGSEANGNIYRYGNAGGSASLFAMLPTGHPRQIFFDPGSSFGGTMIVTTNVGDIYEVSSAGAVTLLASVGEDTEGMDIASSNYGQYAGQLLVASENSGKLRAISPGGVVTVLDIRNGSNVATTVPLAETVSVVPLNLGVSGNPLEGFYVANYPVDVQKANADQFLSYKGDAIVTSEDSANARLWDLLYNGDLLNTFTLTLIGNMPNQSEDGIFVTAERIADVTPAPEPATIAMLGLGLGAFHLLRRRRKV